MLSGLASDMKDQDVTADLQAGDRTCLEGIKAEPVGILLQGEQIDGGVVYTHALHTPPSAVPRPSAGCIFAPEGCSQSSAHSLPLPPSHFLQQPDPCSNNFLESSHLADLCLSEFELSAMSNMNSASCAALELPKLQLMLQVIAVYA